MSSTAKEKEEERVRAVLRRLLVEVFWIRTYTQALRGLVGVETEGLDFFRVAYNALVGDRIVRLLRVLDGHKDSKPLNYLRNCRPKLFDAHLNLDEVESMRTRLADVRDQVVAHIDLRTVGRAAQVYEDAGVKVSEVDEFVESLWSGLQAMHQEIVGGSFEVDDYDEREPKRLADLRDAARRA